jgi:GTP cyclohydrolase II
MSDLRAAFGPSFDDAVTRVDRAIAEIRSGRPVILTDGSRRAMAYAAESADISLLKKIATIAQTNARIVLPAARLRRLGLERKTSGVVALPILEPERIEALVLKTDARIDAPVSPASALDEAALALTALALILPPVILVPLDAEAGFDAGLVSVEIGAIGQYRTSQVKSLRIVGRAPVPLEGAPDTEFVVFRGGEGLRDQVAIIVGKPDFTQAVPVRLHSACLTGDLLGSLKCDCGDQLRDTVRWMADNDGGLLLYLDQEGRGNGLSNKIRAYRLQSEGWDTYDADEVLGFDLDQRRFDFAAEMLRQLGIARVTALTNNPEKIGALRKAGLEVAASKRVLGRPTKHNVRYLASKRDRAGHYIDMDALLARAAPKD